LPAETGSAVLEFGRQTLTAFAVPVAGWIEIAMPATGLPGSPPVQLVLAVAIR
jgi:hypothetical protein